VSRDLGALWHAIAGAAIGALGGGGAVLAGQLWIALLGPPVALGVGTLREWLQHRRKARIWNGHRVWEAFAWGLGAGIPLAIAARWIP